MILDTNCDANWCKQQSNQHQSTLKQPSTYHETAHNLDTS
jgi:hypothetical protein